MMTESKFEPEQFKGRIIFMSMYNDIDWRKRGKKENCIANALSELLSMLVDSCKDTGRFRGLDPRRIGKHSYFRQSVQCLRSSSRFV